MTSLVSIEPDERGFWHVNFWREEPDEEGVPCDSFATTKKGASLDEAIARAAVFIDEGMSVRLVVWEPCETCSGTGVLMCVDPDLMDDWPCDDCDDGLVCREISAPASSSALEAT